MLKNLTIKDFAEIFDESVYNIPKISEVIKNYDFRYRILSENEKEKVMIEIIDILLSNNLKVSGSHRKNDWENGWNENLVEYSSSNNIDSLIPKYVKKNAIVRFKDNYILPCDSNFETNFVKILRYYLFSKYFKDTLNIYEFGCGTGINLIALNELFPEKKIYGLDWSESSCKIINELSKKLNIKNLRGALFDMFSENSNYNLNKDSCVFTIGSMEQLGTNYHNFLDFLLREKPDVIINIEVDHNVLNKNI